MEEHTQHDPTPDIRPGTPAADDERGWTADHLRRVRSEELAQVAAPNVLESAAYLELWRRHQPLVSAVVRQRMRGQDAEHTVTEFFCHKLPSALRSFPPRNNPRVTFEAWLRVVLRNYLNDRWRRGRIRRERFLSLDSEAGEAVRRSETYASAPAPERRYDRAHVVFVLTQIMQQVLNDDDRYIFRARYWEDKPLKFIAKEMGLTEENVRIRHWRAKKRLAKICRAYRAAGLL